MSNGTDKLSYEIHKDSGMTQVWGDSGSGVLSLGSNSSARWQNIPVYGRIPRGQNIPVGIYTDTVRITVNY